MAQGGFQEVINDPFVSDAQKIEKIVFVSGKLYYELLEEREKTRDMSTALVRLEQIAPFPAHKVKEILSQYSNAKKLVWAQEEPKNMGSFNFVFFKFVELIQQLNLKLNVTYVGRPDRSSPATGSIYRHRAEQQQIMTEVFKV
jgi:2-oxoglutarate dehydrogenase E1 component